MERSAKKRCICEYYGTTTSPSCSHGMAPSSGHDYEVFLSFRGPDTRSAFTDFLYTCMTDAGIRVYKDDEDLRQGEEFGPELLQAIDQSKISIPIFSKGYASSVWCLKEIAQMVECQKTRGQKIMPIFYDVAPSEVRHQTEGYGEAFRSHRNKKRYDEKDICQWKAALSAVGAKNGWDLHSKGENSLGHSLRNSGDGIKIIRERLSNKRVLLLLDDVDHKKHMDALVGNHGWFGKGSKLIITTRNKEVLKVPEVDDLYEVSIMDPDQSLQLFSKHAFRRDSPLDDYIDRSNRAVSIAGGLPLTLEVIGSLLCRTKKEMWDATLKMLESGPDDEVKSKLKISFDALNFRQQHMFIDIACLFIGCDKDILVHFWSKSDFSPEVAMEVLQNMSLIKINEYNRVWMHDQLRDLGREMVREKSGMRKEKQSRVWDPEEGLDLLTRHKGEKEVQALRLKLDYQRYRFTYEDFKSLSDLRFFEVDGWMENFHVEERLLWPESPSNVLPPNENSDLLSKLRWLSWHHIPPTFKITTFSMDNVVILDLSESRITHNWKGWSQMKVMRNLKVLNLTYCQCLERTPDFSPCSNLERLILKNCFSLIEIHTSICHLKSLVSLDVSHCQNLRSLPDELGRGLARLEYLSLEFCRSLVRLPDSIGNLESLTELDMSQTSIKELPHSIGNLKNLKVVKMSGSKISAIPEALWTFGKLEEIEILYLPEIDLEIGKCIYKNQSLRILRLAGVRIYDLPSLPESLVSLELHTLRMTRLPDLSNLVNLKELYLRFGPPRGYDWKLVEYPMPRWIENLTKLESLTLLCLRVTTSPTDLSLPPQLKKLHLWCSDLRRLPRLPSSLSSLKLDPCFSLCSMEDLSNLKNLSSLQISGAAIAEIQGLGYLENLRVLELSHLGQVKILPDLSNLNKLSSLRVSDCDKLVEIQGKLPQSLEELEIHSCKSLQKLPCLSRLRRFIIRGCHNLVEIQGKLPQSLEILKISFCKSLRELPNLLSLKRLRTVEVHHCMKLDVEAISLLCSEKSIEFVGADEQDKEEDKSESEGEEDGCVSESEREETEYESEGEDEE